jgi:membrane-associated protein
VHAALIPWLDPANLISGFGSWALLGVAFIVFAETGLLVGFLLPGDTLLFMVGVLTVSNATGQNVFGVGIVGVCAAISAAAFLGGEVGYLIGRKAGPSIFERKESGLFSTKNVERTNAFFVRYGGLAVIAARFVPVVRTFAPVAAGVGRMPWRKYTLYNLIGAVLWGTGITLAGYLIATLIPAVKDFVAQYLDIVLLAVLVIVLVPSVYHYIKAWRAARESAHKHGPEAIPADENLALDPSVFEQNHEGRHSEHTDGTSPHSL